MAALSRCVMWREKSEEKSRRREGAGMKILRREGGGKIGGKMEMKPLFGEKVIT